MIRWLSRIFGLSCCGPWSPWARKSGNWTITHQVLAGVRVSLKDPVVFTKYWQERHCERCGKIQQSSLEH